MKGYKCDIAKLSLENTEFEKVLYTSNFLQLEVLSIRIGEELGLGKQEKSDRFFKFEYGIGKCIVEANVFEVKAGDIIIVPAGAKYNVINVSDEHHLRFFALNAPPN
jgi:mannose-6-phosphate isomerase-like protein (cupin superfamily)